ncbi:MAG: ABC transporter ATP-binding protein [Thermoplasmata archaeon]|nr:ABC transporter ATP-binding protein [Thermoplasmata archaeon]
MILEIMGLKISYGSVEALKGVTMKVGEGEMVALLGPNGSGKTTLLKTVAGILKPQGGAVYIDGRNVEGMEGRELALKVGYVPQWVEKSLPQSVFNAVLIGRLPHFSWEPGEEDLRKTADVLERMGLSEYSSRYTDELSGGERQKVLIARALVQDVSLLLLDEPTANLDLKHQLEVMDIIKGEVKSGVSALLAIHDVNLALKYCDRFILMKEGRIYMKGGEEIITEEAMEEVYGVKARIELVGGHRVVIPLGPV